LFPKRGSKFRREFGSVRETRLSNFDFDTQLRHRIDLTLDYPIFRVAGNLPHDRFDAAGKNIYSPYDNHVISTSDDSAIQDQKPIA
jgi:hypothetical protein